MKFLEESLEKLFNTIKYNGLYIFLSILFPLMFHELDAGREIVLFILNPDQQFNISLIAFSFFLISVSIWCIPVLAIDMFKEITNSDVDPYQIFNKIDRNYNGFQEGTLASNNEKVDPQVPVYILSILPWVIFISNISLVFFDEKIYFFAGILICIVGIIVLKAILKTYKPRIKDYFLHERRRKWIFFLTCGLVFQLYFLIPIPFNFTSKSGYVIIAYYFLGLILLYSFIFIYDFIRKLELENNEGFVGTTEGFNYRSSKVIHISVLTSVSVLWIIFYFFNRDAALGQFNPIVITLIISCILILFLEFFIFSQLLIIKIIDDDKSLKLKLYRFGVLILTGITLYVYFLSSPNNHLIRKENIANYEKSDYDRASLQEYFQKWYDEKNRDSSEQIKDKVFTVYLVSGQGGGSRAAAWFLMNMLYMDAKNKNFYNHIFSISTVSGSSSGANMYYAFHQLGGNINANNLQKNGTVKRSDSTSYNPIRNFTTNLYNRNFLSSGLFGLLLNDFSIDALTNRMNDERRDRNFTLQNEELKAFQESYFKLFPTNYLKVKDGAAREKIISDSIAKLKTMKTYFEGDYLNIYRNNFSNPLFFLNSTVIDDGTKGVFSPVKMDFSMFRDLYGDYRVCNASDSYALPMVSCVNQSQAFPLMNSYNYLHGSGRLGDGGLYENSGTETTLEIYKSLRKYCDEKKINVEFVFINLMNSKVKGKQNINFTKASYLNTFSAMAKNPFYGHEFMAYNSLEKEITNKTDFISIIPENSYTLTRMLSASTINSLFNDVIGKNKIISDNALNKISPEYKEETERFKPSIKLEKDSIYLVKTKPKIFIQYSGEYNFAKKVEQSFVADDSYITKPMDYVPIEDLKNSIRYFHEEDKDLANEIKVKLKANSGREIKIKNYGKIYPFVPKRQIEIWLAK